MMNGSSPARVASLLGLIAATFGGASVALAAQDRTPPPDRPEVRPPGSPGDAPAAGETGPSDDRPSREPTKKGLILATDAALSGYTLFAPLNSTTTYLVD